MGYRGQSALAGVFFGAVVAIGACVGEDPMVATEGPDAGSDGAGLDGPGGDTGLAPVPTRAPGGLAFNDTDAVCSELAGTIVITKAADESDVDSYAIYFGSSATAKLDATPLAKIPKTGANPQFVLPKTPRPPGATHLLAFSANAAGETATGAATPLSELGQTIYTDLLPGLGNDSGWSPSVVIDAAADKLLIVTDDASNTERPALLRCNRDGSSCAHSDLSAGQGAGSGRTPSAVIDVAAGKLLVATYNASNLVAVALFRCGLDGSGCVYANISAGQADASGESPSAVIDTANKKLLVATTSFTNNERPALFSSNLDGAIPAYADISAGEGALSGYYPSAIIAGSNLLVVTSNGARGNRPGLFRCNLDGSGCGYVDISAGQGGSSGGYPSAVIDTVNNKLLVATTNGANGNRPGLFRCAVDGTACSYSDISAGQGAESGWNPTAIVDTVDKKLLVVTANGTSPSQKAALFRCELDGTACTFSDISAGQGPGSGSSPRAVLDPIRHKLLAVTRNDANFGRSALFDVCLR